MDVHYVKIDTNTFYQQLASNHVTLLEHICVMVTSNDNKYHWTIYPQNTRLGIWMITWGTPHWTRDKCTYREDIAMVRRRILKKIKTHSLEEITVLQIYNNRQTIEGEPSLPILATR